MFLTPTPNGFHLKINGYTLSVQVGTFNYCDNRDYGVPTPVDATVEPCHNAEMAIFNPQMELMDNPYTGDQVAGWVDLDELFTIIFFMQRGQILLAMKCMTKTDR